MKYSKELHDRVRQNLRMFDYPRFDDGDIDTLLDEIERLQADRRWIPVGERLPDCALLLGMVTNDIHCERCHLDAGVCAVHRGNSYCGNYEMEDEMSDYSEMTDEELNEAIALKRGWTVVIPDALWTRGTCAKNDIEDTRELPDYTHDWRLCGDLLEEMRNQCFVSLMNGRLDNPAWVCSIFLNPACISTIAPTPQRAICEAWLAWKELEC